MEEDLIVYGFNVSGMLELEFRVFVCKDVYVWLMYDWVNYIYKFIEVVFGYS